MVCLRTHNEQWIYENRVKRDICIERTSIKGFINIIKNLNEKSTKSIQRSRCAIIMIKCSFPFFKFSVAEKCHFNGWSGLLIVFRFSNEWFFFSHFICLFAIEMNSSAFSSVPENVIN